MISYELSVADGLAPVPQQFLAVDGTPITTTPPEARASDQDPTLVGTGILLAVIVLAGLAINTIVPKKKG